ncbi:hypothetical protein [Halobaculum roseum]|uniref:Uncharacterized protein n=1 Tax=Halobaculum roseum TaxID=2175149 RepID=A0ABD5MQ17_9EURY|nr:hypothetical protein [Halobaculum roseum]QZY04647.1 hypothetical protein K6T36_16970 [Halobaculum roseum]
MHHRRALLRAAGVVGLAGLAGCTGLANGTTERPLPDGGSGTDDADGGPDDGGNGDGTRPSDREYPPGATHEAAIASQDAAPELPISPRVSLANPYVTDGSPVVLRVDVENDTDEPVVIGEYRPVVFQYVRSADGALVWYPHSKRSTDGEPDRALPDLDLADEGCWRLASGIAQTMEYGTVEIPGGGTLTAFVGLYVTHDASGVDGCFPTGTARFETTYTDHTGGIAGDEESPSAEWGFDLAIEAIDPA